MRKKKCTFATVFILTGERGRSGSDEPAGRGAEAGGQEGQRKERHGADEQGPGPREEGDGHHHRAAAGKKGTA